MERDTVRSISGSIQYEQLTLDLDFSTMELKTTER